MRAAMEAQKILDDRLTELVQENRLDSFQSSSLFFAYPLEDSDFSVFEPLAATVVKNKPLFFDLLDELNFSAREEYKTYYEIMESAADITKGEKPNTEWGMESIPQLKKFIAEENGKIFLQTYVWPKFDYKHNLPSDKNIFRELNSLPGFVKTGLQVTGTFQVFKKVGEIVRTDFFRVSLISLLAVLILIFAFFRNVPSALLSLIPLCGAVPFTLAFVVLANISFSPFQIGIAAMLIGIGIDDSLHLLTRTRSGEKKKIREVLPEIGPIITLTTLSTLIGFGALIFSHNQAVSSMGFVIAVGVFSCLLFTFLLIPAIIRILEKKP